jgi:hypothetical protein
MINESLPAETAAAALALALVVSQHQRLVYGILIEVRRAAALLAIAVGIFVAWVAQDSGVGQPIATILVPGRRAGGSGFARR